MNSTKCRSEIFGKKNYICIEHVQTFFLSLFPKPYSINNHLHSVYITYGITQNLEIKAYEAVHWLNTNTASFCIRDLSILGFCDSWEVPTPNLLWCWGDCTYVCIEPLKFRITDFTQVSGIVKIWVSLLARSTCRLTRRAKSLVQYYFGLSRAISHKMPFSSINTLYNKEFITRQAIKSKSIPFSSHFL